MPTVNADRAGSKRCIGLLVFASAFCGGLPWVAANAERIEVVAVGVTDNTNVISGDPCGTQQVGGQACNGRPIAIHLYIETGSAGSDGFAELNHGYYRSVQAPGFITGYAVIEDPNSNDHLFRMPGYFQYNFDQLVETFDDLDYSAYGLPPQDRVVFAAAGGNASEEFVVSPGLVMAGTAFSGDLLDAVGDIDIVASPLTVVSNFLILSQGSFRFTNATGSVQGQFLIHQASMRFVLPEQPQGLPDVGSDGVPEVAALRGSSRTVEVRNGASGALLGNIAFFDGTVRAVGAVVMPDTDGNGVAEIAVLGRRKSDLRTVVEIRNLSGPQAARQVWFEPDRRPVDLAVIVDDADGNGVPELAVLSRRNSDGRGVVELKNASGAANTGTVWLSTGLTPIDLEVVPDADGNGVPEVAVLSSRSSDGRAAVEVKNASGTPAGGIVWCSSGNAARDLAVSADSDANSVPELAVLLERRTDRRGLVEVRNASGASNARVLWLAAGNVGMAVQPVGDADGNTVADVAILAIRDSDARALVEVKNTAGAVGTNTLWYPSGFTPVALSILDDVDGNGIKEAMPLLIRNSDGRVLVESRNASGNQAKRDYWFSP
jgi:hypothetical protein